MPNTTRELKKTIARHMPKGWQYDEVNADPDMLDVYVGDNAYRLERLSPNKIEVKQWIWSEVDNKLVQGPSKTTSATKIAEILR